MNEKVIVFNAKWHERIFCFKQKYWIIKKILGLLFFPLTLLLKFLRMVCRRNILPSSGYAKREVKTISEIFNRNWFGESSYANPLKKFYTLDKLTLITPDGAHLNGFYFKSRLSTKDSPTVLLFQPNASLTKHAEYDWLMEKAALDGRGVNFLCFDYRGCGQSTGTAKNIHSLLLDGDTAFQYLKEELKLNDEQIYFYGYSLGGGISAGVRALYPEKKIRYVNERSFASITSVIRALYPKAGWLLGFLCSCLNWNLSVIDKWAHIHGEKLIIYQPEDEIIPYKASLFHALQKKDKLKPEECVQLHLSSLNVEIDFHHSAPLHHYIDKHTDNCAQERVMTFLFAGAQD